MTQQSDEPVVALVAAAGSGSRLGAGTPKALRPLAGVPLVTHSVARLAAGGVERAVVMVADGLQPAFATALASAPIPWTLVVGGSERQHSVRLGLAAIESAAVVLVHDAARPMVPPAVVAEVIAGVRAGHPAVVPALPVVDSIRRLHPSDGSSAVVDRAPLRAVQTPQGFAYATLVAAHDHVARAGLEVTDDAACCEALGHAVHLVPGSRLAMKVTERTDLVVAEALLAAYADELA
ncbi:MAG: 2-C-methyl-D-erythritol 4-phosphate cytidylyltransferase [Propionibacteriaceae bacterium]|nr:2-C-methyl-D-erythritol 4-phosphate cytidylyltransferase [Propionibacteriaceae bacterium]